MEEVTAEQARSVVQERGISAWPVRRCSICGTPITYTFTENEVALHTSCGCTQYYTPPKEMTYEEFVASTFNYQSNPEVRERMWQEFSNQ